MTKSGLIPWLAAALWAMTFAAAAQNYPSPNAGPFRTTREGDDERLMLAGHDAVAYFARNEAVRGNVAIKLVHLGVTFRFASESSKAEFLKSPEKYMPQFGGYCANGINYAIPGGGGGGPDSWRIYRGKLYVFGGQNARDHFEMDTERNLELAHRYWNDEIAGRDAASVRSNRLWDRVPHYKSNRELDNEWGEKLEAKTLPVMPGAQQAVPQR